MAKVLFLQNVWYDYIGVMMLSAVLKKAGHESIIAIGNDFSDFRELIQKESPDMICFSLMSGLHLWANETTEQIRRLNLRVRPFVIFGGPHPTFFPNILEKSMADAICIGEGDGAIVDFADCISRGEQPRNIENLFIKSDHEIIRNPIRSLVNLDNLPFADRSIYYKMKYFRTNPTKSFMTGRGCPFGCTFCYNKTMRDIYHGKGSFVRHRSPENVLEEIQQVKNEWGMKTVYFFDDTFGLNKKWVLKLMELYKKEVNLPFLCRIRADTADEEIIAAFSEAGCVTVSFAIETANQKIREKILKKHITDEDIFRTAKLLKKYRIKFFTYNMVGIPEQSIEDIHETINLNIKIGTSYPWCSIFNPFPGTELADYCIKHGYIDKEFGPDKLATTFHKSLTIKTEHYNEINNLHKFFQLSVLFPILFPILKRAARLKPNFFYSLIFAATYCINHLRSEKQSLTHMMILAHKNMKIMLGWK